MKAKLQIILQVRGVRTGAICTDMYMIVRKEFTLAPDSHQRSNHPAPPSAKLHREITHLPPQRALLHRAQCESALLVCPLFLFLFYLVFFVFFEEYITGTEHGCWRSG